MDFYLKEKEKKASNDSEVLESTRKTKNKNKKNKKGAFNNEKKSNTFNNNYTETLAFF